MKKFLTMALALIMVLSLFAVPTMAVIVSDELITNGDIEDCAEDYHIKNEKSITMPHTRTNNPANSSLTKVVVQDGNKVVQASSTLNYTAINGPEFAMPANVQHTASIDVRITKKCTTIDGVDYGKFYLTFWNALTTRIIWGEGTATSKDGQDTITGEEVTFKGLASSDGKALSFLLPLNTWYTVSAPATATSAYTAGSIAGTIEVDTANANEVYGYFDNFSLKYQEEKAEITTNVTEDGKLTGLENGSLVDLNSSNVITLTPEDGSYLKSLTVGGTDVTNAVTTAWNRDAYYFVSTYTVVPTGDTAIVAEFADYYKTSVVDEDMEDSAENWTYSSSAVTEVTTDPVYGNVLKVTSGEARTPSHAIELGLYKVSFDAKADTAGNVKLQTNAATDAATCKWNGTGAGIYNKAITTEWAHYEAYFEPILLSKETTYLAMSPNGAVGVYLDNVKIEFYSTVAVEPPVDEPTEFNVTGITNDVAFGTVTPATGTVAADGSVTFTVTPKFGYYVSAATLNTVDVLYAFTDVYAANTYTVNNVAENVELAVTFAPVTAKGENVATLPAVCAPAGDTAITFGKVLDRTNATSWGIELTRDGKGVTPHHGGSYLYKANTTKGNGQYAIEFIGLEAGTYTIRSYVYVNGTATFGAPTTFTVVAAE